MTFPYKEKKCVVCGGEFFPMNNAITCSDECSVANRNGKRNIRRRVMPREALCASCGGVFKTSHHNKVTCSKACQRRYKAHCSMIRRIKGNSSSQVPKPMTIFLGC